MNNDPLPPGPDRPGLFALAHSMVRDRLFRRLVVASLFAAAFVWVAIDSFRVETGVVWRYFLASIGLVGAMILIAIAGGALLSWIGRRRSGIDPEEEQDSDS